MEEAEARRHNGQEQDQQGPTTSGSILLSFVTCGRIAVTLSALGIAGGIAVVTFAANARCLDLLRMESMESAAFWAGWIGSFAMLVVVLASIKQGWI